jgi:CBS domain containing-hemolysin-like protein
MSAVGVCREKAALSSEREPTGDGWYASAIASASAFLVVSYVFADLEPKSIALSAPVRTAMLIASPLRLRAGPREWQHSFIFRFTPRPTAEPPDRDCRPLR